MVGSKKRLRTAALLAGVAMVWTLGVGLVSAQTIKYINPGTEVPVRTSQTIDASAVDGRVFTGTVDQDVRDTNGRVAIPRGSTAELVVRTGSGNDLYLDLDSVTVNGQRYAVDVNEKKVAGGIDVKNSGIGNNDETLKHVGGGALLGTVVGAIIAGGKGAAIGAVAGGAAGAGAQVLTHGRNVSVPAETLVTYRLQSGLDVGVQDTGYDRNGVHYHHYQGEPGY